MVYEYFSYTANFEYTWAWQDRGAFLLLAGRGNPEVKVLDLEEGITAQLPTSEQLSSPHSGRRHCLGMFM